MIRQAKQPLSPSLVIKKAEELAQKHNIVNFKASWKWLSRFRDRKGLKCAQLHGEGGEVNRNNPNLLSELDKLYDCIQSYRPEYVYNMDETGLFYRMLPRYTLLLPYENVIETRGRKKAKERVSMIVCAKSTGSHKLPCCMVGKPKSPVRAEHGLCRISIRSAHGWIKQSVINGLMRFSTLK